MKKLNQDKKKILHIIASNSIAGAENVLLALADNIDRNKFDITIGIYINKTGELPPLWKAASKLGISSESIRVGKFYSLFSIYDVYKIVLNYRPDVVHTHGFKPNIIGAIVCIIFRIPIVTTFHGWLHSKKFATRIFYRLNLLILHNFNKIIAVSEQIEEGLIKHGIGKDKIVTIKNVPYFYENEIKDAISFRQYVNIPIGTIAVIGFVGRLELVKGCQYFIDAITKITKLKSGCYFLIIGEGSQRTKLEEEVKKQGITNHVKFCGFQENVKEVYQTLDLFVLPSLSEGIPLSLLEAMAVGTPVIATSVGGVPEVVSDSESGYLIPPADVDKLVEKIITVLENPQLTKIIAEKAKLAINEKYNHKEWIGKIEDLYQHLKSLA